MKKLILAFILVGCFGCASYNPCLTASTSMLGDLKAAGFSNRGYVWYTPRWNNPHDQTHSICYWVDNGERKMIEPQTGYIVKLTKSELESATFIPMGETGFGKQ